MAIKEHPLVSELRAAGSAEDRDKAIRKINNKLLHPDLWSVSQVAEYLGIPHHQNVYKLWDQGLPKPVRDNPRMLWDPDMIKVWGAERRRKRLLHKAKTAKSKALIGG